MHIIEGNLSSHTFIFKALFKATQWKIDVNCASETLIIEVGTYISGFVFYIFASFITNK